MQTDKGQVIVVQGDVKDDLVDFIQDQWPQITDEVMYDYDEKTKKKTKLFED